jgi:NADH:ubiquinone oxidoreductase subunit
LADRDEINIEKEDATDCTDPTRTSNEMDDSNDGMANYRSCPAEWQAWLEAISKITDACPEAYQHVSKTWPKLYHECNEIAARYKKQPATDKDTIGMVP